MTHLRFRPAIAFTAALPFIVPTPIIAANFLQSVEPLLYVLILWALRDRPFAFGALLAFGFLQREFTMYAEPALAVVKIAEGSFSPRPLARWAMNAAGGFAVVWLIIDRAKMFLSGTSLLLQAQQLGTFTCFTGPGPYARIQYIFTHLWPVLSGGTTMPLDHYAMRSSAIVGSPGIGWIVASTLLVMLVRLAWLWRSRRGQPFVGFALYLAVIGGCALAAYTLTCSYAYPVVRYFTLGVFLPIGAFAAFMAWERLAWLKAAAIFVFALWGTANLLDNVQVLREAYIHPQPNPHAELAEFLRTHQIRYARASYWDSYIVDFLSRERVIVGSSGPVRIPEYERLVDEHRDSAAVIERMPCVGEMYVAAWCIQLPPHR